MMENFDSPQAQTQPKPEEITLKIGGFGIKNLDEIRRWAKFLAILGFIAIGMMGLGTIMMAVGLSFVGSTSEIEGLGLPETSIIIAIMAVFILVYFFPTLYLLRFAEHAKKAIEATNNSELDESLNYLKKYARFIGIMTIVIIALYVILIPVTIITGVMAAF